MATEIVESNASRGDAFEQMGDSAAELGRTIAQLGALLRAVRIDLHNGGEQWGLLIGVGVQLADAWADKGYALAADLSLYKPTHGDAADSGAQS
ncbi:hypothetical protein [Cognatilysobacter bugurensis]|uniref:Uncharacterized protein n=1 Tax=Cognatilysobacter bugurensis TaxID=543356 RepID=A0A918SXD6_9GAMM|nr:hypothetical protein [Lysobacter bugurensis]GHA74940.1 hypothetical protein GCM10007067_10000 [Lysobacter bugurensis]